MKTVAPPDADELFQALRPALRLVHHAVRQSVHGDPYDEAQALAAVADCPALAPFGPSADRGASRTADAFGAAGISSGSEQRGRWLVERVVAAVDRVRGTAPRVVSGAALNNAGDQALALWSLYLSTGVGLDQLASAQEGVIDPPIGGRDVQQKIESRMWLSARPTGRAADAIRTLTMEVHAALRSAGPGRDGAAYDDVARTVFAYESRRMEALGLQADLQLLILLRTLDRDPLPVALLTDEGWGALPVPLRNTARSPAELDLLVSRLVERGLLRRHDGAVSLAPSLFAADADAGLAPTEIQRWTDSAVRLFNSALPQDTHYHLAWPAWAGITGHLLVVLARAEKMNVRINEVVNLLDRYSVLLRTQGRDGDAVAVSERAVRLCESSGAISDELRGTVLGNLALALSHTSQKTAAVERMRESLACTEAAFGRDHHEYVESLNIYADILGRLRKEQEADTAHREAVAIGRALVRENGDEAMANVMREALNDFASSLLKRKPETGPAARARAREALALLDEAEALGEYSGYGTLQIGLNRATASRRLGDLDTAERTLRKVIATCEAEIEGPNYLLFAALADLSEVLELLGDGEGAARALVRAHEVDDQIAEMNDW